MTHRVEKRLIVHCGVQKTASTAFHHFVQRNRDVLGAHVTILTPEKGTPTRELGRLCALFSLGRCTEGDLAAALDAVRAKIEMVKTTCIVSHENIPGAMPGRSGVVELFPRLDAIFEIFEDRLGDLVPDYAFYTRQQDAWKVSVHNQAVKSDHYTETLETFLADTANCDSWAALQKRVEGFVGAERVHFLALEDEEDRQRPGSQLLRLAGVPEDVIAEMSVSKSRSNESLNAGSLEFLRLVNRLDLPRTARTAVAKLIQGNPSLFVNERGAL
ncbi:hypothetical protein [Pelagimonas sp. KU-00592-HH]|uniref:hypothetical protein n=1 Tax=Pelagimonas sp. KU-00592-HH TaxID=3127651 RepID=UPI003341CD1A